MTTEIRKPRIVISRCLLGDECRWDGDTITDPIVNELRGRVEFIPVCPEMRIGLGLPRPRIIFVGSGDSARLLQPSTGNDLTDDMINFTKYFLSHIGRIDGFILKHKSPSCGLRYVKRYEENDFDNHFDRNAQGFFAREIVRRCPNKPAVNEEDLLDQEQKKTFFRAIGLK